MHASDLNELQGLIADSKALMIYFYHEKCNVCHSIKPKLKELIDEHFTKIQFIEINTEQNPEISAQYQIFALPAIMLFFNGKLILQKARNFSIAEVLSIIQRPYNILYS